MTIAPNHSNTIWLHQNCEFFGFITFFSRKKCNSRLTSPPEIVYFLRVLLVQAELFFRLTTILNFLHNTIFCFGVANTVPQEESRGGRRSLSRASFEKTRDFYSR